MSLEKDEIARKLPGQISMTRSSEENNLIQLNIGDNGIAQQNDDTNSVNGGFGTMLIELLTVQLGGKLEKNLENSTTTSITFTLPEKSAA